MKKQMIEVGEKRQVSFDKSLRLDRQKNYDISQYEYVPYTFRSAGDKKVYKNFNFSIFVDDYCNADCKFCVAQLRYSHRQQMYQKPCIEDDVTYLKRLEQVLDLIRPLNPSVSITGGEPTLSPKLPQILKMVDERGFRKRTITTNGSGLLKKGVLNQLIQYHWNHLNISRVSYDDVLNQRIMRYGSEVDYCNNAMLKEIIETANQTELKHRLSCLLLQDSVSNVDEMRKYLEYYERFGVNNYIFRELMDFSKDSINQEKIQYCNDNKVRLNQIWTDLEQEKDFEPYMNLLGYYYYVEIYRYHNMTVASESANLNQQYKEKDKHKEQVYEMIFHPNGNLCGSWVEYEDILDEYR